MLLILFGHKGMICICIGFFQMMYLGDTGIFLGDRIATWMYYVRSQLSLSSQLPYGPDSSPSCNCNQSLTVGMELFYLQIKLVNALLPKTCFYVKRTYSSVFIFEFLNHTATYKNAPGSNFFRTTINNVQCPFKVISFCGCNFITDLVLVICLSSTYLLGTN